MLRVLRKIASIYVGGFIPVRGVRGAPVDRLGHAAVFWRLCTRKPKKDTVFNSVLCPFLKQYGPQGLHTRLPSAFAAGIRPGFQGFVKFKKD